MLRFVVTMAMGYVALAGLGTPTVALAAGGCPLDQSPREECLKVDFNTIDSGKENCLALGCCFGAPKSPNGPWCFHPKAESDSSSEVPVMAPPPPPQLGVASAPEGPESAPEGPAGAVPDHIVQKRKLTKALKRIAELERKTQAWADCMKARAALYESLQGDLALQGVTVAYSLIGNFEETMQGVEWPIMFPITAEGALPTAGSMGQGLNTKNGKASALGQTEDNTALSISDFNLFRIQMIHALRFLDEKSCLLAHLNAENEDGEE